MTRSIIGPMGKIRVLMVCRANICRSVMAEGMMRQNLEQLGLRRMIRVDSAGTRASQPGHQPDARAQKTLSAVGVSVAGIKARQVTAKDMVLSDYILAMDCSNYNDLMAMCPPEHQFKIRLLLSYAPELAVPEVPDPYYGSVRGFEEVFRLIEPALNQLLQQIVNSKS